MRPERDGQIWTTEDTKVQGFCGFYTLGRVIFEEGTGAGEGNRTLVVSLGSFCSAIELHPRTGLNQPFPIA